MADIKVPYLDLKAQYQSIKPEIDAAIARVLDSCQFVLGDEVASFATVETLVRARAPRDAHARATARNAHRIQQARGSVLVGAAAPWSSACQRSTAMCRVRGEIVPGDRWAA